MLSFKDTSIRNKLRILIVSTNALILLIIAALYTLNNIGEFRRNMVDELFLLGDLLGKIAATPLHFGGYQDDLHTNLQALRSNPHIILVRVFSADGRLFVTYSRDEAPNKKLEPSEPYSEGMLMLEDAETDETTPRIQEFYPEPLSEEATAASIRASHFFGAEKVDIFKQIQDEGELLGAIQISSDTAALQNRLYKMFSMTVLIFGGAILLALLLANRTQKMITRPIYALLDTMRQVSEKKDYSLRSSKYNDDELGALIDGFNGMLEKIETGNIELQETNDQLTNTLETLRATQQELILSEKMASLGQLIAGIAHEINTPLGVIRASIDNIKDAQLDLNTLPQLLAELEESHQTLFHQLIADARHASQAQKLSARDRRKLKKQIYADLEAQNLPNAESVADYFMELHIHEDISQYLPLLSHEKNVEILKNAYNLKTQETNSSNIKTAVERMSKIVFALKTYAHHDHSGEAVTTNIPETLDTVLTLYHNQLKHGIEVHTHYDDIPPVKCYPDELSQVWTNLIHNAIQAMEGQGTLDVEVQTQADTVVVRITDSGSGIPADILGRIFEPFFTTKPAGEGSGLGLDIVRKIVEKHNGQISAESEPGKTCFNVSLPILHEEN
jgi:signal transduction histidine kinase